MARRLTHFRDPYLEMQIEELLKVINPIAEINVTGSAVTSVSFTGLDGIAHGGYVLEAGIYSAAISGYSLLYNGDNVETNYRNQYLAASGTGVTANNLSSSRLTGLNAVGIWSFTISEITISADGKIINSAKSAKTEATPAVELVGHHYVPTATNLTRIDVFSNVAGGIGIGSRFRLFRRL